MKYLVGYETDGGISTSLVEASGLTSAVEKFIAERKAHPSYYTAHKRVLFVGHCPENLGGYYLHPVTEVKTVTTSTEVGAAWLKVSDLAS
jgi:hypothetical protein